MAVKCGSIRHNFEKHQEIYEHIHMMDHMNMTEEEEEKDETMYMKEEDFEGCHT